MIDLNQPLGRDVPTAQQVLEVIRPELRAMRCVGRGMLEEMREDTVEHDPDYNCTDAGDQAAFQAVFHALRNRAMESVVQWAGDMELVFDKIKVYELIRQGLLAAESNMDALPGGFDALRY